MVAKTSSDQFDSPNDQLQTLPSAALCLLALEPDPFGEEIVACRRRMATPLIPGWNP
ncbi:hypothetical protein ACRALDRAFT_1061476 [Sodiomyces alcalophilus JCM 7366]|uniref:uncharacterized protein n=1 Tax=Sodiomyces alcalophilus JCM 7366 TaxID=591952 RepID=UPI0039B6DBBD